MFNTYRLEVSNTISYRRKKYTHVLFNWAVCDESFLVPGSLTSHIWRSEKKTDRCEICQTGSLFSHILEIYKLDLYLDETFQQSFWHFCNHMYAIILLKNHLNVKLCKEPPLEKPHADL